jgi:hypothetical protein
MNKILNALMEYAITKDVVRMFGKKEELSSNEAVKDMLAKIEGKICVIEYYRSVVTLRSTLLSESINKNSYQKLRVIFSDKGRFENIPFCIVKWEFKNRVLITTEITIRNPMFRALRSYTVEIYGKNSATEKIKEEKR